MTHSAATAEVRSREVTQEAERDQKLQEAIDKEEAEQKTLRKKKVGTVTEITLPLDADGLTDLFDPVTGGILHAPKPPDTLDSLNMLAKPILAIRRDEAKSETVLMASNGMLAQESRADQ